MVISCPAAFFEAGVRHRLAVAGDRLPIRIDEPTDRYIYIYIIFFNPSFFLFWTFSEESDLIRGDIILNNKSTDIIHFFNIN